jgi:hypothetical protein
MTASKRPLILVGVALLVAVLLPLPAVPSSGAAATGAASVRKTKTVTRTHLIDGKNVVADKRTVTVNVDQTKQLSDRQTLLVNWSGAHPTSNGVADPNSDAAAGQEYPLVLLECHGVDSASASAARRLSPQTCWTQTPGLRYFTSPNLEFPPWRVDRYAAAADRKRVVGAPKPRPSACLPSFYPEYWLHFRAADGHDYPNGPQGGCAGFAPEETTGGSTTADLPGNTTFGATAANGTGQARFVVWNSLTNSSLGCGPSQPCSLVAVPIEGISCDVAATKLPAADRPTGDDATAAETACTDPGDGASPAIADEGALWWSASNWRNRITIPLTFAPLPTTTCASTGDTGVDVYGSELMTAATLQWDSKFCSDPSLFPVTHVQTGETQARNLLATGNTDAAYTVFGQPGGYHYPIVSAPTAMTGFVVGYAIDDAQHHEYTKLKLTPRLLAKLLTESYPTLREIKAGWAVTPPAGSGETDYTAAANNPLDITQDPEFQALNPGVRADGLGAGEPGATLAMLSSESDVVRALTSYINADPEARAWLDGQPDPWGMVVNPHYRGIQLPVDSWPLLDTYEPIDLYNNSIECLQQNPIPYLPLVASPINRLAAISLNLQYAIAQSQTKCIGGGGQNSVLRLVPLGAETIGSRFLIGITSWADALRYRINAAALQTRATGDASKAFTDATGRTFVAPSTASMRAASNLLQPDSTTGTWQLPYDALTGSSASTSAYPGAMLVSTAIPTKGLAAGEAHDYAAFLRQVAGPLQTSGAGTGQLPTGYLPLTSGDGLGAQQHYTQIAAQYVAAQNGKVPSLTDPKALPSAAPSTVVSASGGATTPHHPTVGSDGGPTAPADGSPSSSASPSAPVSGSTTPVASNSSAAATGRTPSSSINAVLGVLLPLLALLGLLAGAAAPALARFTGRRT